MALFPIGSMLDASQPLLVVYSTSAQLVCDLPARLAGRYRCAVCESPRELIEFVESHEPQGMLLDFTPIRTGGHVEDRLLELIRAHAADAEMTMFTAEQCPEPLARRAAMTGVRQMEGVPGDAALDELVDEMLDPESATGPPAPQPIEHDDGGDTLEAETILHGITRRFETNTPALKRMLGELEVAATHDVTILIIGETGSGKTYLSRLIHEVSPRRDEPFLTVACGALPNDLIESELFGHVKGAFTSAHADKDGKFLAAGRGTILLDEIDVLGPEQQVKLLRVIETGEFEPVGSNQTHKSQARLVVASNLDLQPLVEQGKFRPDLYYRLNMLKFDVSPLRERKPDIKPLARKFIEQLSESHKVRVNTVESGLYEALYAYPWPGNVRELENVIRRAVIYCRDGVLSPQHLPPHIVAGMAGPTNDASVRLESPTLAAVPKTLDRQIAMTEKEIIEEALFKNNFSRTKTAKSLGISRVTLYNKMKKYEMNK